MLLVLSNGGYLAPPDEKPELEELWPNFFAEVFPEEAGKAVGNGRDLPLREKVEDEEESEEESEKGEKEG
jgi:brefeldin A-resistance guanine nucleotide exchange factor 1